MRMREIAIAPGRWDEAQPAPLPLQSTELRLNFAQGAAVHLGGSCDRMMIPIGCLSTSTAKAVRRADHTSEGCAVVLGNSTRDNPCATRRGESLSVIEVGRQSHAVCGAAALTVILIITTLIEETLCGRCSSGPWYCATPSNAGGHFGPISVLRDRGATRARSKPEHSRSQEKTSQGDEACSPKLDRYELISSHSVNQVWLIYPCKGGLVIRSSQPPRISQSSEA